MITVKETLGVSAEAFFQQILKSAAYDVELATNKKVTEQQLYKGYQYTKKMKAKMGNTGDVKVKITELDASRCYSQNLLAHLGKI